MDDIIDRLVQLKKIRDEAQAGIEAILGTATVDKEKRQRAPQKCSICSQEGHTARSCPTKQDTPIPALTLV